MVEHQRWILSTPEWSTTDSKLTPCIAISMASELNTNTNTSIPTHCPQAGDFTIVCHTIQSRMFGLHPFSQKMCVPTLAFFFILIFIAKLSFNFNFNENVKYENLYGENVKQQLEVGKLFMENMNIKSKLEQKV